MKRYSALGQRQARKRINDARKLKAQLTVETRVRPGKSKVGHLMLAVAA